ncbi:hypothetical protein [Microbacterium sp. NPDC076895]|uniref:hypothetical protein n=1 Tax=Microbacterium sp. NPDC076895 TaxID=3154957 RepID=UPI0034282CF5
MSKLLLHIGTHKTGTTSVQHFFASNRDALRAQGIFYPPTDLGGQFGDQYAHHAIAHAIANVSGDGTGASRAKAYFDALRDRVVPGETVVISAEPLYRHRLRDAQGKSLGRMAYLRAVRDAIGDFDVSVIAMVRRQDLFLESLYSENIMAGTYRDPIERFIADRAPQADYAQRLAEWGAVFGSENIHVRPYEAAEYGASLERYFLQWVGGTVSDSLTFGSRRNVTVPRELVEFKRVINASIEPAWNAPVRHWVETMARRQASSFGALGKFYLTSEQRARVLQAAEPGNRDVARQYLGRSELFSDTTLPLQADPPPLPHHTFEEIAGSMVGSLARDAARVRR